MGQAIEIVVGRTTAPGAVITGLTVNSGNSYTVRYAREGSEILLLSTWAKNQAAGIMRVRSPLMHDNVQGIRHRIVLGNVFPRVPYQRLQRLNSQDQLAVELSGSAVAGDVEIGGLLLWYEDLIGTEGRFISSDELDARAEDLVTVEAACVGIASGDYGASVGITAAFDTLRANTDYAVVGYQVDALCGAVRLRSADFGNLGIGGPGLAAEPKLTSSWFVAIASSIKKAAIPVFNSANKGSVLVDVVSDENVGTFNVNWLLCQLRPG